MNKATVVIADDHRLVLEGIRKILETDFRIMGVATDGYELLDLVIEHRPDVAITDLSMPGLSGIDVLARAAAGKIRTKFVLLTMHADAEIALAAFHAGAAGYVLKQSVAENLSLAIRTVVDGDRYIDPGLAPHGALNFGLAKGKPVGLNTLTKREVEVLKLVAEGRMLKEIAGLLRISESTAGFHKYNMMHKLNLHTTAEITQHAIRHGLIAV